jgi:hypothetical protein
MARVARNSPFLKGVSGKLDGRIIKQMPYGPVITKVPDMSNVKPTKLQKEKRDRFKEAVAYAQLIKADPVKNAAFKKKLKKGRSVYNAAIAEYLKNTQE